MESLGKGMVIAGLALVLIGMVIWWVGPRWFSGGWLPGDISVKRGNVSFHFPIVTCLVVSVVLTLLTRLFNR
jgi:hypothetical protein